MGLQSGLASVPDVSFSFCIWLPNSRTFRLSIATATDAITIIGVYRYGLFTSLSAISIMGP